VSSCIEVRNGVYLTELAAAAGPAELAAAAGPAELAAAAGPAELAAAAGAAEEAKSTVSTSSSSMETRVSRMVTQIWFPKAAT
jgi:hypothetical protein